MDDGIREKHGVVSANRANKVTLMEGEACIEVSAVSGCKLTPEEAMYIAGKLKRLAERVRQREVAVFARSVTQSIPVPKEVG